MARRHAVLVLVACGLLAGGVRAGEVYTWKDKAGVVHYGDAAAAADAAHATTVDLPDDTVSEADRRAAQARLARLQAEAARATPAVRAPAPARRAPAPASGDASCEAAWARYRASVACFEPYRFGRGRIKPEAYDHCTEVLPPADTCH